MTKTALANKELREKRGIERSKLLHDTEQQALNRQAKDIISQRESTAKIRAAKIGAIGSVGSGLMKGYFAANDPEFYKGYISDLQDFVNVPTYNRIGNGKFIKARRFGINDGGETWIHDIPGIMIMKYDPTVGPQTFSNVRQNPVNQSLSRTKEKVLSLNSRSSVDWEASDLGYNQFCSADIAVAILELGRVIKVYQTYQSKNAYLAEALITALGWNYSDLVLHYDSYRKNYDVLVKKFNSVIVVPADSGLMKRKAYLASNIFIDSEDEKYPRQMYAFVAAHRFVLSDTGETCTFDTGIAANHTLDDIVALINTMMARISDNPSFSEMYEDLRHAFGSNLFYLPESVTLEQMIFNTLPLNREQLHNLECVPLINGSRPSQTTASWALRQDTSGYLYQGAAGTESIRGRRFVYSNLNKSDVNVSKISPYLDTHVFNVHKELVTGDDIIDISRLKQNYKPNNLTTETKFSLELSACGTEVITAMDIWSHAIVSEGDVMSLASNYFSTISIYTVDITTDNLLETFLLEMMTISLTQCFNWCPIITCYAQNVVSLSYLDAVTTFQMDTATLRELHEACVLGELYYPDRAFSFSR